MARQYKLYDLQVVWNTSSISYELCGNTSSISYKLCGNTSSIHYKLCGNTSSILYKLRGNTELLYLTCCEQDTALDLASDGRDRLVTLHVVDEICKTLL